MKLSAASLFTLFFSLNSFCQHKEFEFKNLTQENGLPSNESYFVYRDSKYFLWFATDQGVVRYNGSTMEHFELPDNVIFKIREDSKGRIWFFSHTGKLAYFYNGVIYPYEYNDRIVQAFKSVIISNAYISDDDEVIVNAFPQNFIISKSGVIIKADYTYSFVKDSSVFIFSPINQKKYFARQIKATYNSDTTYINIINAEKKIAYKVPINIGVNVQYGCETTDGRNFYFYSGKTIVKLNQDGSYKTKKFDAVITSIELDDNLWVGFIKNGALLLDSNLNPVLKDPVLNGKSVTSISRDYEDGIWFSTLEKGVYHLKNYLIKKLTGDSAFAQPVFRLYKATDSILLFATSKGVYKLSNNIVYPLLSQSYNKVTDLFIDNKKKLFIAGDAVNKECNILSSNYGFYRKGTNLSYPEIYFLTSLSEIIQPWKNKYLMTTYEAVWMYDMASSPDSYKMSECFKMKIFDASISKPGILFLDTKKQLWMGSINALYKFNYPDSTPVQFKPGDSLFNKGITCMRQLENGIYSIGIRFGGIALMRDTEIIARITENEGLLSNSIKYLLPVKNQLWAATAKGISVIHFTSYTPIKYTISNIGKNSGIYDLIIYQLMSYNGNMLAATSSGIYEIDNPEQFLESTPKRIPFYINSISYYKGDTSQVSSITLPYKNNRAIIRYSAVCFNIPEEIKYYYRIDNTDTTWHEVISTELLLENLIPGNYNLEIRAAIPVEQRFSDIQKIQIIVEKAWWQNNWLKILIALIIIGSAYYFYKKRVAKIRVQEQSKTTLNTKMLELEQTALRAQMNPHFIFNCLTSIQQLIATGNKEEANDFLVKFARLIRKTLDLSAHPFISVEEETSYLKEYMVLEQLRIPGQFEFSIYVDPLIDRERTEIPNMMLQLIIENSIRHGIKHLTDKKGNINVMLQQENKHISCIITDNGIGRHKNAGTDKYSFGEHKSFGMDILGNRLEAYSVRYNTESTYEIIDLQNGDGTAAGTKVIIKLPFKIGQS